MVALRKRSKVLTAYFEAKLNKLIQTEAKSSTNDLIKGSLLFDYITPVNPDERGCQLSIRFKTDILQVFNELEKRGVVVSLILNSF